METTICACCKSIIPHGTDYWWVNDAITEEIKGMPKRFKVIDNATTPLKSISELKKGDTICEPCYKQLNSPNIFKKKIKHGG